METPFFTYQGSKASIRKWILPFMPGTGSTYLEPFAGRGNMFFLAKQNLDFKTWILNDIGTCHFLSAVASQDARWFPETMTWELFKEYKDRWEADRTDARALLIEPGIAHLGHYRSGWMGKYTRTRKWDKAAYTERIQAAQAMLADAMLFGFDWADALKVVGQPDDFVYLDPPYLDTEHRYYNDIDHVAFLAALKGLTPRWLLSHTDHPLYREHLGEPFQVRERKPGGKAVGRVAGGVIRECLWKGNY